MLTRSVVIRRVNWSWGPLGTIFEVSYHIESKKKEEKEKRKEGRMKGRKEGKKKETGRGGEREGGTEGKKEARFIEESWQYFLHILQIMTTISKITFYYLKFAKSIDLSSN